MDYKYDNGIELLLAHMNIEDIINAAETLYQLKEEEEAEGLSFDEEGLSQEEMDENEEVGDPEEQGVRYGTVTDLLSFVNLLSNMQTAALQHLPQEMGVLLNKVRRILPLSTCAAFVSTVHLHLWLPTTYCRRTWL